MTKLESAEPRTGTGSFTSKTEIAALEATRRTRADTATCSGPGHMYKQRFAHVTPTPSSCFEYFSDDGCVGVVARYDAGMSDPDPLEYENAPRHLHRKTFKQFRAVYTDREQGMYLLHPGLNGTRLPLYRRADHETNPAHIVFVVEGEKCADALAAIGLVAVTNAGGAGRWHDGHTAELAARTVVVIPDNDEPGHTHALKIAGSFRALACPVRILELPDWPGKETGDDVVDWLTKGGSREALLELVSATPKWDPAPPAQVSDWPAPQPLTIASEPAPYPVEALGPALAPFAESLSKTIQVDVAAAGALLCGALAVLAGNRFSVRVSRSHAEPTLARFELVALLSGERKTSLFRAVFVPIDEWIADHKKQWQRARNTAAARRKLLEQQIKRIEQQAERIGYEHAATEIATLQEQMPEIPPEPRIYGSDTTPEALVRNLKKYGGSFSVVSADGRGVIDSIAGRYSSGKPREEVFLKGHGNDTLSRDRVGSGGEGEGFEVHNPSVSVVICVQPDVVDNLALDRDLNASGFLARCNICCPASRVGQRLEFGDESGIDAEALRMWTEIVGAFLHARFQSGVPRADEKIELVLSADAMEARRRFANKVEKMQRPGGPLEHFRSLASKTAGEAARLAGLLHAEFMLRRANQVVAGPCEEPEEPDPSVPPPEQIPLETWLRAERSQRWHLNETIRCLMLAHEPQRIRAARALLAWCAAKPDDRRIINARTVLAAGVLDEGARAQDVGDTMDVLVAHGFARELKPEGKSRASRYEIHPNVFEDQS